jgi:UDP-N-acetylmuramate dehydrogenase
MKYFEISATEVKVPAGWLIEQAGFKGKRFGDAGVHKNQALVLVNYGNATGQEILAVSKDIQDTVFKTFGIRIEAEVNVI